MENMNVIEREMQKKHFQLLIQPIFQIDAWGTAID